MDRGQVDVHQHLWTEPFVDALRRRRRPPYLVGWTLHVDGEPPYDIDPATHDVARRTALAHTDGLDLALVSLSAPLGIETLPADEAAPLLDAYHDGTAGLPRPFGGWASACLTEPDPAGLERQLDRGFVGLQLPATALLSPAGYERCAPLLETLQRRGAPLLVHAGPAGAGGAIADDAPGWWPAMVPYVHQMHAAWFAFRAYGRPAFGRLRTCLTLLAGLAPLHGERLRNRGGDERGRVDMDLFVETSSYGPRAIDATVRVLGVDVVVHGSDRPYAPAPVPGLGEAADAAFRRTNPHRLIHGKEAPQ